MALFATAETKALETLRGLHSHRGKLEAAIVEHETELSRLRAGGNEEAELQAFLNAPAADSEGFPVAGRAHAGDVEQKIQDLRGARAALIRKIKGALGALGKTRGEAILKRVKPLRDELAAHRAKTAALLRDLETHTRCKFQVDELAGADVLTDASGHTAVFRRGDRPMPRAMELEREIALLEAQARKVEAEAQRAGEGGRMSGATLAELLVVCDNPELLAPVKSEIERWHMEASSQAEAEWQTKISGMRMDTRGYIHAAPDRTVHYTLAWVEGAIARDRSTVTSTPVWDIATAKTA